MAAIERTFIAHCAVSARLAGRLGLGDRVVGALWQTFARWDGKGLPRGLRGGGIVMPIQIANIANVAEYAEREHGHADAARPRFSRNALLICSCQPSRKQAPNQQVVGWRRRSRFRLA